MDMCKLASSHSQFTSSRFASAFPIRSEAIDSSGQFNDVGEEEADGSSVKHSVTAIAGSTDTARERSCKESDKQRTNVPGVQEWLRYNGLTQAAVQQLLQQPCKSGRVATVDMRHAAWESLLGEAPGRLWWKVLGAFEPVFEPRFFRWACTNIECELRPELVDVRAPCTIDRRDEAAGPKVHIAYSGSALDLVMMSHEAGHALQTLCTTRTLTPPVYREISAFLGEWLFIDRLRLNGDTVSTRALALARTKLVQQQYLGEDRERLKRLLDTPDGRPYDYRWNYPVAFLIAARLWQLHGPSSALYEHFADTATARASVAALIDGG